MLEIVWYTVIVDWLCWGLTTRQPLRVILCRLPEKGRKEIEERVEELCDNKKRTQHPTFNTPPHDSGGVLWFHI